jgi:hypothetical protein
MPQTSFGIRSVTDTELCAQTQTKINFESVAKQCFQNLSFGSFDLQLL